VSLRRYLERLRDTIYSRQEIKVEHLRVQEVLSDRLGAIEGRLRFYDDSLLEFTDVGAGKLVDGEVGEGGG